MRISKNEAIGGGVSDPRNSTILKFFSLIRFGERAGSGLSGILHVWEKVYHTDAFITEMPCEVERTVLTLPFNEHEQDVDAMLQLYDNPEELTFPTDTSTDTTDTSTDTSGTSSDTTSASTDTNLNTTLTPKQQKVLEYCEQPHTGKEILEHLGVSYHSKNIKKYITDIFWGQMGTDRDSCF